MDPQQFELNVKCHIEVQLYLSLLGKPWGDSRESCFCTWNPGDNEISTSVCASCP